MPFKPIAEPEDYPERFQVRPQNGLWVARHQTETLRKALGGELWDFLEKTEKAREVKT